MSIAEMRGIDLDGAVEAELAENATRAHRRAERGVLVKADETLAAEQRDG